MQITEDRSALDIRDILETVKDLREKKEQRDRERFDGLCKLISTKRNEAVNARKRSGIEKIWEEDEEYYEGVDEFNRTSIRYNKPHNDGPLTEVTKSNSTQCTAFFNITRQFVDSAAARAGDILLPQGDWNWGVKKTPVSDDPGLQQKTMEQAVSDAIIAQKVDKGERRIKDWLVEAGYHREYRRALENAAKIGTGILKGPFPKLVKSKAIIEGSIVRQNKIVPSTKSIDPDNFFPDMNCGEDIQRGDYVFERDYLTGKQLSDLRLTGQYIEDAIDKVLKEGPGKRHEKEESKPSDSDLYEIWYFTGNIDSADLDLMDDGYKQEIEIVQSEDEGLEICGCEGEERGKEFVSMVVVLVNDTVIKGHINPIDDGSFPYDVMVWQRSSGSPFGIGISRQMRVAQQLLLSSARNMVDNMALSSMPMIAMRRKGVIPEDGKWAIEKGKVWWLADDVIKNVNEAIQYLVLPPMQQELMNVMLYSGKMAEDMTGVNSLLQGQQGAAPDTVGGMELLHRNASALLRRIARFCDETTEKHIGRYYDWLLMYGEDDEKGDFEIEAIGSSILVEREIDAMQAQTLLQYAQDPNYGLSKSKIMSKIIKSWGWVPSEVEMDDEEKQQLANAQPQVDPRLQTEKLRSQTALQIADQNNQVKMAQIKKDADRDAIFAHGVNERNQITYQSNIQELQLKRDLAMLEYANQHQMQLDDIKAKLASDSMKLSVQKELAGAESALPAKQMLAPPTEPPQRAQPGMAYQQ